MKGIHATGCGLSSPAPGRGCVAGPGGRGSSCWLVACHVAMLRAGCMTEPAPLAPLSQSRVQKDIERLTKERLDLSDQVASLQASILRCVGGAAVWSCMVGSCAHPGSDDRPVSSFALMKQRPAGALRGT